MDHLSDVFCVLFSFSHHGRPTRFQWGSLLTYVGRAPIPSGFCCLIVGPHTLSGLSGILAHLAEVGCIGSSEPIYHYWPVAALVLIFCLIDIGGSYLQSQGFYSIQHWPCRHATWFLLRKYSDLSYLWSAGLIFVFWICFLCFRFVFCFVPCVW